MPPIKKGQAEGAGTLAIVFGVLELHFGGVIPGILLIITCVKINDGLAYESGTVMA